MSLVTIFAVDISMLQPLSDNGFQSNHNLQKTTERMENLKLRIFFSKCKVLTFVRKQLLPRINFQGH